MGMRYQDRTTAIEFTLTPATAAQLAEKIAPTAGGADEDRASYEPLRFRVLVPQSRWAARSGATEVVFVQEVNSMGETVWRPLGCGRPIVAGLAVAPELVRVLALHGLCRPTPIASGRTVKEQPNGSVIIDLGSL
jgi:hypothetical protein